MPVQFPDPAPAWEPLRRQVAGLAPWLSAPPALPPPALPSATGLCGACRGPAGTAQSRCYQCGLHAEFLAGLLPDVVVPVAYAQKGGVHATNLWRYKSARADASASARLLRALLAVFLHDHGQCAFRSAGFAAPTHVAVVPSGRGRPGAHPLWSLAAPCQAVPYQTLPHQTMPHQALPHQILPHQVLPRAALALRVRDDQEVRDLDPGRFRAERLPGARVLLLDDTWTTGASAVSATAALKLAGADAVAVIVLGRHVGAVPGSGGAAAFSPAAMPFVPALCAVHRLAT